MNAIIQSEIALIERILSTGLVREAKWWEFLRKRFIDAGWIELSKRKAEWSLCEKARAQIEIRLNALWVTRANDLVLLQKHGLNSLNPKHLDYFASSQSRYPASPYFNQP